MSWGTVPSVRHAGLALVVAAVLSGSASAQSDPAELLQEAERLAWLRAWTRAEPLYAEAERHFTARGDRRNALYARINRLRGQLPRLPVPEASEQLAQYLEDPLVQRDERLRLRALVIKGDTDVDLDPVLAERSWREALELAERLGEAGWANRARGELGLVAFLQGDISTSVINLGQAMTVAETNGDIASLVRWLTLFGHGHVQLARPAEALDYYDRALKAASTVPELRFPLMTYDGKADALVRLERFSEAEDLLDQAAAVARQEGALGYQAQFAMKRGLIAHQQGQTDRALELLEEAVDFARGAGGDRILTEIALQVARIERARNKFREAEAALREGIEVARAMQERFLLPRLLAELAELQSSQRRYADAAALLGEALEGLFTRASSPWVQSRLVSGMDEVFTAQIRLEGAHGPDAGRLFSVVEQARGRSLLELLMNTPIADLKRPAELREAERQIAALQVKLFRTTNAEDRQQLLEQIFLAEERLAPMATELFDRSRRTDPRHPVTLADLQSNLRTDELFLEFVLAEPTSYCLVVTRTAARVQRLPGRSAIGSELHPLVDKIRSGADFTNEATSVAATLLGSLPEIAAHARLIVSPDGELHHLPFELLVGPSGRPLLETHVVSYIPSGSVLTVLRDRPVSAPRQRVALAVSASPGATATPPSSASAIERSIYGLDGTQLRPLPAANDEVRAVAAILGPSGSTVLVGESATELELKRQPLSEYQVVHFAVHGIPSARFPARAALLLHPAGDEDGVLQAREILALRFDADLVTLSACDTGSGALHGQDGVLSLVRPFLASGARAVVANLWAADDTFSLSLMREFYRQLAAGADIGDALRRAKLRMLELFGPEAVPRLWSGVLVYGDGANAVAPTTRTSQ